MSRYVDEIEFANALVKKRVYSSKTIGEALGEAPSIDIVRCGECKMWMSEHLCQWWSRYGTVETDADDFCSYGEREGE